MKRITISLIVDGYKIHHHNVHCLWIQSSDPHLKRRKHSASRFRYNHFGALLVEFIPQRFRFERNGRVHKCWMIIKCVTVGSSMIDGFFVGSLLLRFGMISWIRFGVKATNCLLLKVVRHTSIDVLQWFVRPIFSGRFNARYIGIQRQRKKNMPPEISTQNGEKYLKINCCRYFYRQNASKENAETTKRSNKKCIDTHDKIMSLTQ